MNKPVYTLKAGVLSILLFLETYALSQLILNFVKRQNYFSLDIGFSLLIIGLMLLTIYTFALTVGAWNKWEQYLIIPFPVSFAIFIALFRTNLTYAVLVSLLVLLLLIYDIYKSTMLKELLIRFDPKIILRFSTRGLLFIFAILGGVFVILHTATLQEELNIGAKIAEITEEPIKRVVEDQIHRQIQENLPSGSLESLEEIDPKDLEELDPSMLPILENFGILESLKSTYTSNLISPEKLDLNIKQIVENQVNQVVQPYKSLVQPVIAILIFAIFQFYAAIAYFLYMISIDLIFWLAKKSNFLHQELIPVEKENLKF